MTRSVGLLAMLGVMSTVVSAFAGDKPPRTGTTASASVERNEPVIRPPALIPSSRGYRPTFTASEANSTDRHVAEFLRWKAQYANPR
jgi:hypothetical protein